MSTYFDQNKGQSIDISSLDAPPYLRDFLNHQRIVNNLAPRSVMNYYIHIRQFLRWVKFAQKHGAKYNEQEFLGITISDIPIETIQQIADFDIYEFLSFSEGVLGNKASSRSLKLTAIKAFFRYLTNVSKDIDTDPSVMVKQPKREKRLPKYLSFDECIKLMENVSGDFPERDMCIILLFLTCGLRLSELAGIDLSDIKEDKILIFGKGRKERVAYLNEACLARLIDYLEARENLSKIIDEKALFLSKRTGKRLTGRRIEQIIKSYLEASGLGNLGYSVHTLRHSAATLLYQGNGEGSTEANILVIKEILGHSSTAVTELYTHLSEKNIMDTVANGPFSKV